MTGLRLNVGRHVRHTTLNLKGIVKHVDDQDGIQWALVEWEDNSQTYVKSKSLTPTLVENSNEQFGTVNVEINIPPIPAVDGGGQRLNSGKLELSQCPTSIIAAISAVFMRNDKRYGGKYETSNWRRGMSWDVVYNCLMRHMLQWKDGEDTDPESGLNHLYHAAANLAMLIEYAETYKDGDDRYQANVRNLAHVTKEYKKCQE